ncbi:hypothetical protein BDR06DRAFT_975783 [Suillus hirtellus]|nr:hypothetical protein BDR06DRAFT_975783 [Suillus hirtellus]
MFEPCLQIHSLLNAHVTWFASQLQRESELHALGILLNIACCLIDKILNHRFRLTSSVTGESLTKNSIPTFSVAKANSTLTTAAKANSTITVIVDGVDKGAKMDAAPATSSVLNMYKGTYFNVPVDPEARVNLYYITKGQKLGVFSGCALLNNHMIHCWTGTGLVLGSLAMCCALYAKTDSLEEGITIVKSAIEDGTAVRV